jgi:hypothetical protein
MGNIDYRFQGEIGQKLAEAFLLRFLTPARPEPDPGIDALGHLRMTSDSPVCFNFQVKTGMFTVDASTLEKWVSLIEREPVILLHVRIVSLEHQEFRFLILHDWIIEHPDWQQKATHQKTLRFPLKYFQKSDTSGAAFQEALAREIARVLKKPKALWRTRNSPRTPFTENDLFHQFGRIRDLEVPNNVLREVHNLSKDLISSEDLFVLLKKIWSLPKYYQSQALNLPGVRDWINQLVCIPAESKVAHETRQFRKFVIAMKSADLGRGVLTPGFTYKEISCWRIFCQLYPESMRLLMRMFNSYRALPPNRIMALSLLTSTLANSDDPVLANRAVDLLVDIGREVVTGRAYTYRQYKVSRQVLFTIAEAKGTPKSIERFINFCHLHPLKWDLCLNRQYYEVDSDESQVRSTLRKIHWPKPRDLRTQKISLFFLDRFNQNLVDEVQKRMNESR